MSHTLGQSKKEKERAKESERDQQIVEISFINIAKAKGVTEYTNK